MYFLLLTSLLYDKQSHYETFINRKDIITKNDKKFLFKLFEYYNFDYI